MSKSFVTKNINGRIKFLLTILLIYIFVGVFDFSIIQMAITNFSFMFIKIVPILLVVFMVMILVNIYFTKEKIRKYLGEKSGIRGWVYAVVSGILVSGPPYVLFPLLGELKRGGMKNSLLAVFLYNRNVKIPFLPVMIYYFGFGFTIILSLYIVIFSILNGKIVGVLTKDKF